MSLEITAWRSLTDPVGRHVELTWEDLAASLADPEPKPADPEKPNLRGWSPATFRDARRAKDNVLTVTALGLDHDKGSPDVEQLKAAYEGLRVIVHNTRRSTPDAQRWRVVVAVSRPMTAAEHAVVWAAMRDRLSAAGLVVDEATKDPSRFWFVPCVPAMGAYCIHEWEGEPLDVDALLAQRPLPSIAREPNGIAHLARPEPPPSIGVVARPAEPDALARITPATRRRRAVAYAERAEAAVSGQEGHKTAMRVVTAVVRGFALDVTDAREVLAGWNARCEPPWSGAELDHKIAEAARIGHVEWGAKLLEAPAEPETKARVAETRPDIKIGVDLMRVVDQAVSALADDRSIYQRDGQLVHVVRIPDSEDEAKREEGTPGIRALATPTLRERLCAAATWLKYDGRKKDWCATTPSADVVGAVASRAQWSCIRPIVGVIEAPSLRPDGSVLDAEGYDAVTGYVHVPGASFPAVPERPTREDAQRALIELGAPLKDFRYPSEAHRSATLAAILTLVGRPAIVGSVPAFVFDASTRGSGKTLQADVVSIIATGRVSAKMGYPADDEELEKVLGAYALRGAACVNFDNVARPFGGGPLDRCITAVDSVELRVLGKSEVPALRWRAVILATGNNVEYVGDTSRRVLVSRIEPLEENPEDRIFEVADLRAWTLERRARLVVAALTVLRAYVVAGRPDVGVRVWGSFEAWSRLVPAALVWAGAADPLAARPSGDATSEPEKAALGVLLALWPRLGGAEGITAKAAVQALYPGGKPPPPNAPPDGYDDLRDAVEMLTRAEHGRPPSSGRLAGALRRHRDRNIGGVKVAGYIAHGGAMKWSVRPIASSPSSPVQPASGEVGEDGYFVQPFAREIAGVKSELVGETTSPISPTSPEAGDGPEWWETDT